MKTFVHNFSVTFSALSQNFLLWRWILRNQSSATIPLKLVSLKPCGKMKPKKKKMKLVSASWHNSWLTNESCLLEHTWTWEIILSNPVFSVRKDCIGCFQFTGCQTLSTPRIPLGITQKTPVLIAFFGVPASFFLVILNEERAYTAACNCLGKKVLLQASFFNYLKIVGHLKSHW